MKEYLNNVVLGKRAIGNLIAIISSVLMLITSIIYISIDGGQLKIVDYSRTLTFVCVLLGSLLTLSLLFFRNNILEIIFPFASLILYAVGLGRQLYLVAYPLADLITGVNWFGGSLTIYLTMFILLLVGTLLSLVGIFLPQNKKEEYK